MFVWVEDVDSPIKRAEPELLEALEKYRFDPGDGRTVGLAMPENAPSLGISDTDSGWRFYGTPLLVSAPASQFFSRLGFEMAFVYNSEHTAREGWDDFQQRIEQHDKAEIQDVVVTVGGPDRFGFTHPSEEAIFDLMLDDVRWSYAPQWTERVFAHGWESGRILQVHPTVELVSAGLFQGWVPAHQPLVPR